MGHHSVMDDGPNISGLFLDDDVTPVILKWRLDIYSRQAETQTKLGGFSLRTKGVCPEIEEERNPLEIH